LLICDFINILIIPQPYYVTGGKFYMGISEEINDVIKNLNTGTKFILGIAYLVLILIVVIIGVDAVDTTVSMLNINNP
jgi:hypothetical protein